MVEYHPWGPSRRYRGDLVEPPFRPIRLPAELERALDADPAAPAFLGSSSKHFDNIFEQLFFGYDNKLLSPADARATAVWIERWAAAPGRDPEAAKQAIEVAARLVAAADFDWYFTWEQ